MVLFNQLAEPLVQCKCPTGLVLTIHIQPCQAQPAQHGTSRHSEARHIRLKGEHRACLGIQSVAHSQHQCKHRPAVSACRPPTCGPGILRSRAAVCWCTGGSRCRAGSPDTFLPCTHAQTPGTKCQPAPTKQAKTQPNRPPFSQHVCGQMHFAQAHAGRWLCATTTNFEPTVAPSMLSHPEQPQLKSTLAPP